MADPSVEPVWITFTCSFNTSKKKGVFVFISVNRDKEEALRCARQRVKQGVSLGVLNLCQKVEQTRSDLQQFFKSIRFPQEKISDAIKSFALGLHHFLSSMKK